MGRVRRSPMLAVIAISGILMMVVGSTVLGNAHAVLSFHWGMNNYGPWSSTSGATGFVSSAAFSSDKTGLGGFSGNFIPRIGQEVQVDGIFSLTNKDPHLLPPLPCGAAGEVGGSGTIVNGSFLGAQVTVASCVGTSVHAIILISTTLDSFTGVLVGDSIVTRPVLAGAIVVANTSGAGSAGGGFVDAVDFFLVIQSARVLGGGAFVGSLTTQVAGTSSITSASSVNGCETDLSGVVSSGLFLGLNDTSSFIPVSCPPPTFQQQGRLLLDGAVSLVLGPTASPVYAGHGSGIQAIAIPNLIE